MNNNNLECYICLDPVSNDINSDTYILECCKNRVHLECLQKWYSNNNSNSNCFICNQYNQFCNDIMKPVIDNSYILININNVDTIQTRRGIVNNYFKKVAYVLIVTIVVIVVCFFNNLIKILISSSNSLI